MTSAIDAVIHPLPRLRVCALLAGADDEVAFSYAQKQLDMTAVNLSKQIATLCNHGYVTQRRGTIDARTVWLTLTPAGRRAYDQHIAALVEMAQLDVPK